MSFGDSIKTVFSKYAQFGGRAARPEYWWWALFVFLVYSVLSFVIVGVALGDEGTGGFVAVLAWLGWLTLIIPSLAVFVRRMHDTGRSGWWWFLGLIPIVGPIVLIVFLASAGDPGPNQYGDPPAA